MCYHPIDIINPSKYISLSFRDRYVIQVPCGKCAACVTAKSSEWSFRLYYHALDTFRSNGFVLFDTLTYDNKHLPHISDYYSVSSDVDFPCFSSRDLRLFVADLRQRCKRKYNSNFSYFIASEYGTSERHLHRPHYHVLFFVTGKINPLDFSRLVSATWNRGRTDGVPFQSATHVLDNSFTELSAHAIRSLKYVSKYIQKSSKFQKEIDFRLNKIMESISNMFDNQGIEGWSQSSHYWRVRESISRKISQFHRQSTLLGASALGDIDLADLFKSGKLNMPDNEFVVKQIPLPTYYKRKLFYELVEIDGSKSWVPTQLGEQYILVRSSKQLIDLTDKFSALKHHVDVNFDSSKLADYCLNFRGRFKADKPSLFVEKMNSINLYNYVNRYDKEWFNTTGLSIRFLGNTTIGYSRSRCQFLRVSDFIRKQVYFNSDYEKALDSIFSYCEKIDKGRQRLYEYKQHLGNLLHFYFP